MGEILIDSYSEVNASADTGLYTGHITKYGQSFTAKSGKLSTVKFFAGKVGLPTGNGTVTLYAHTGTYGTDGIPTGSVLAVSDNYNVASLTASNALISCTFSGNQMYRLNKDTHYCIIFNYIGGDADNYVKIACDNSSPTHSGNSMYYVDSWAAHAPIDVIFYVYAMPLISNDFSGFSPWIFLKDMWDRNKKLWTPDKKLILPKDLGFNY